MEVLISRECDIWLSEEPATQELLKRELGAESAFRRAKGYYLDPVPPDLPMVPVGWEQRLRVWRVEDIEKCTVWKSTTSS